MRLPRLPTGRGRWRVSMRSSSDEFVIGGVRSRQPERNTLTRITDAGVSRFSSVGEGRSLLATTSGVGA
jgi:hypothetical protein